MKLSVLVPAYNLEKYISDCLVSLLTQNLAHEFEVIVCDDASTDNTANVIRNLESEYNNLRAVYKTLNHGLAKNMQTLVHLARGEYVAYVDGDDLALPGKLTALVNYLDRNRDCHMVYHESEMFESDTGKAVRLFSQTYYNWAYIPRRSALTHLIQYGTYMQASSVMFRNHPKLKETTSSDYRLILDYPFYLMNAGYLQANIDFIPSVLGRYRIHSDSFAARTRRDNVRRIQSADDMIAAVKACKKFGISRKVIDKGIVQHEFAAALFFLFKEEDSLFQMYIEKSSVNRKFFNDKHELSWTLRRNPNKLRKMLQRKL